MPGSATPTNPCVQHSAQLPTPDSGLQISDFSQAERELEISIVCIGRRDTGGCCTTTQIFLSSLKLNPCFGHLGFRVNLMGYFSSGTSVHLSSARSFLLGWEEDSAPVEERRFKGMKSPQPTPALAFYFKGRGQEGVAFEHNSRAQFGAWTVRELSQALVLPALSHVPSPQQGLISPWGLSAHKHITAGTEVAKLWDVLDTNEERSFLLIPLLSSVTKG